MLLQRLNEYGARQDGEPDLPSLYSQAPVRYIINLDDEGRLLNPRPTDTANPKVPAEKRGVRRPMPQVTRSVGIKPLLLADNAEYTLGLARDPDKQKRVDACHEAYMALLERCAERTGERAVAAVRAYLRAYLRADPVAQLELDDDFDRSATMTFRVGINAAVFPTDLPEVQAFWAGVNDPDADPDKPAPVMQCIVCGQTKPVLTRLQGKIKGVPGGQTAGTSIISANEEAYLSYGLEASLVAPTCASCGERFTRAANSLLSSRTNRLTVGDAAFIFWTRDDIGFDAFTALNDPNSEEVRALLDSARSGKDRTDIEDTNFYAAALSASGGRVVVRDWIDTTVGEVQQHLKEWFAGQNIVDNNGQPGQPIKLFSLAAATVREVKDLPVSIPRTLLHTALTGAPLPRGLLYQAVRRNRAEQGVTRPRAALIKLVLESERWAERRRHSSSEEEDDMVHLSSGNDNAAYRCGRLLAVLEEVQEAAIGTGTIVDRFFGTASSAPASVFGRLLRGAQPHLSKLHRDKRAAHDALQRRLEEVQSGLTAFPRTLTLEDQGMFSLGYYHQRAWDRAQRIENAARRKQANAIEEPDAALLDEDDIDGGDAE